MLWLSDKERLALTIAGICGLLGFGVVLWQQRHSPLVIEAGPPPPYARWEAMARAAKQIDINQATAEEFERLPEIGPSLAQRIVAHRAAHGGFAGPEGLLEVPGIGPKTYEALKDYVTTNKPASPRSNEQ